MIGLHISIPVSTIYTDDFSVWTAGRPVGVPFTVDVQVRYPEELIRYSY